MLTATQNLLETIKVDGKPDRLLKQYEGATFFPPNPANNYVRGNRHRGMEPMKGSVWNRDPVASGARWLPCPM